MSDATQVRSAPAALSAAGLAVLFVVDVLLTADALPERVASHFGFDGTADGWLTRRAYVAVMIGLGLGLTILLAGAARLAFRLPAWAVGIPNAEVWLSPEHRRDTMAFTMQHVLWLACLMLVFVGGIHHLTIDANRSSPARLDLGAVGVLLGSFFVAAALWSWILHRRFAHTPGP